MRGRLASEGMPARAAILEGRHGKDMLYEERLPGKGEGGLEGMREEKAEGKCYGKPLSGKLKPKHKMAGSTHTTTMEIYICSFQ